MPMTSTDIFFLKITYLDGFCTIDLQNNKDVNKNKISSYLKNINIASVRFSIY